MCSLHHSQILEHSQYPNRNLVSFTCPFSPVLVTTNLLSLYVFLPIPGRGKPMRPAFHWACFQGSAIFQNVSALHIFVLSSNIPLYEQTTFNYSFTSRWTLVLCLLFGHYKDLRNFGTVYKVLCGHVFNFLGCIPRSGIAGSYGNSMFNLLRSFWLVFQNDYTILHSNMQWMRVSISLHSWQCLLLSVFFILSVVGGVNWYHIEALVSLSWLMMVNTFVCFLTLRISLEKTSIQTLSLFFNYLSFDHWIIRTWLYHGSLHSSVYQWWILPHPFEGSGVSEVSTKRTERSIFLSTLLIPCLSVFPRKVLALLHFQDFHVWVLAAGLYCRFRGAAGQLKWCTVMRHGR